MLSNIARKRRIASSQWHLIIVAHTYHHGKFEWWLKGYSRGKWQRRGSRVSRDGESEESEESESPATWTSSFASGKVETRVRQIIIPSQSWSQFHRAANRQPTTFPPVLPSASPIASVFSPAVLSDWQTTPSLERAHLLHDWNQWSYARMSCRCPARLLRP